MEAIIFLAIFISSKDEKAKDSNHDFGKDIIPNYLKDGLKLQAYRFKGYWKDVGTIDSLWEANMDLISDKNTLDLSDPTWKIYTGDNNAIPQIIGPNAKIDVASKDSIYAVGTVVNGRITTFCSQNRYLRREYLQCKLLGGNCYAY